MRFAMCIALTVGVMGLIGGAAIAQQGGGMQMPPEFAAKMKLWTTYREQHKKAIDLSMTVRKIEEMNKMDGYKLDKKQSVKVLAIMKTWSSKPALTEDEAGTATKALNSVLTAKQTQKLAATPAGFGGGGRPGGGAPGRGAPGGGRPGGGLPPGGFRPGGGAPGGGGGAKPGAPGAGRPGGPGGAMMNFPDPPKSGVNPFNPNAMSGPIKDMMKKSLDEFKADLQKQSH